MDVPHFFVYSPVNGHLNCFYLLAVVNSAAMTICVQVFVWIPVFNSLMSITRNKVVDPYCMVHFLKKCQSIIQTGCSVLCFHKPYLKALFFLYIFAKICYFLIFLIIPIFICLKGYHIMALICPFWKSCCFSFFW